MDTATAVSGRAAELRKRVNALYRRKGETEAALQREHIAQEGVVARRQGLVAELPGADSATEAWAHSEIDVADSALKVSIRTAEGLQGILTKLVTEIAGLEPELREADLQVEQEKLAKAFEEFRGNLERCAEGLTQTLDAARRSFACLHIAAQEGMDKFAIDGRFRIAALNACEEVFAAFYAKQMNHNLEGRGLRRVHAGYQNNANTGVFVQPMTGTSARGN
jgi:hypothetical protein